MAKFLIGVLVGFILTIAVAVSVVFAMMRVGARKPVVADNSTIVLRLDGALPERPPVEFPIPLFQQQMPSTVTEIWALLRRAASDSRIKAVVFEPAHVIVGWGKLQEIRADLEQFRKSGKPLFAYLKSPTTREYFLATAANRVYMAPEDELDMKGLRAELIFFKKTLDKIGAQVEIEHAGKYKDFGDMFTRTSMSPETREVLDSVLDDLYDHLLSTVAAARNKTVEEIRATLDEGPFLSRQALNKGLVDALFYEDQMYDELKKQLNARDIKKISHRDYLRALSFRPEGKRIAMVVGEGGITRGEEGGEGAGEEGIGSEGFDKLLRRVEQDSSLSGVVVRIDSPGGDAFASDEIWREMNLLSKKKPLVISMSDAAASGGYYISMTGDPIVAYPGTFTGSIGVLFGKVNLHGLYDKLGITKDMLMRGRFADIDSDYHPLTPEGRAKLREAIDEDYKAFVSRVAQARKRSFQEVEPLAQGRVWLGSQAKRRGLVDELGGLDRAIELVKQKARIPRDEKVSIIMYPPKRSIFEVIFSRPTEVLMKSPLLDFLKSSQARVWMRGGLLRVMPYAIEVN